MARKTKDQLRIEELEDQVEAYQTILGHVAPDVDVDAELDNIAYRKDGTPVYIGDLGASVASEEATEEPEEATETDEDEEEEAGGGAGAATSAHPSPSGPFAAGLWSATVGRRSPIWGR